MSTSATVSPHKMASRIPLHPTDPSQVRLPDSPDKRLRAAKSYANLSSTQSGARKTGIPTRPSKEQLTANPIPPLQPLPTRSRGYSDAPMPFERPRTTSRKPTNPASISSHARKSSLELTFRDGPPPGTTAGSSLSLLRHSILTSGVTATRDGMSDYRVYLWLALLDLSPLPTDVYLAMVHRGRSPAYEKISNDVFRTLATDTLFKRRVTDASLTRVLNATAWRIHDERQKAQSTAAPPTPSSSASSPPAFTQSTYLQGINVLLAPLLYASRSEAQAYSLLTSLLTTHVPSYITPTMSGVHNGLALIDRILAVREPNLASYLLDTHKLPAKIYAFPSVLTLCACTPPLPEVLKLWDFLFAYGTHLNVICVVAQLMLMKQKLYESNSPGKVLRAFPNLDAGQIIKLTLVIVRGLPEDLYAEIVMHGRV